jgi:hypothetical protein
MVEVVPVVAECCGALGVDGLPVFDDPQAARTKVMPATLSRGARRRLVRIITLSLSGGRGSGKYDQGASEPSL